MNFGGALEASLLVKTRLVLRLSRDALLARCNHLRLASVSGPLVGLRRAVGSDFTIPFVMVIVVALHWPENFLVSLLLSLGHGYPCF